MSMGMYCQFHHSCCLLTNLFHVCVERRRLGYGRANPLFPGNLALKILGA